MEAGATNGASAGSAQAAGPSIVQLLAAGCSSARHPDTSTGVARAAQGGTATTGGGGYEDRGILERQEGAQGDARTTLTAIQFPKEPNSACGCGGDPASCPKPINLRTREAGCYQATEGYEAGTTEIGACEEGTSSCQRHTVPREGEDLEALVLGEVADAAGGDQELPVPMADGLASLACQAGQAPGAARGACSSRGDLYCEGYKGAILLGHPAGPDQARRDAPSARAGDADGADTPCIQDGVQGDAKVGLVHEADVRLEMRATGGATTAEAVDGSARGVPGDADGIVARARGREGGVGADGDPGNLPLEAQATSERDKVRELIPLGAEVFEDLKAKLKQNALDYADVGGVGSESILRTNVLAFILLKCLRRISYLLKTLHTHILSFEHASEINIIFIRSFRSIY